MDPDPKTYKLRFKMFLLLHPGANFFLPFKLFFLFIFSFFVVIKIFKNEFGSGYITLCIHWYNMAATTSPILIRCQEKKTYILIIIVFFFLRPPGNFISVTNIIHQEFVARSQPKKGRPPGSATLTRSECSFAEFDVSILQDDSQRSLYLQQHGVNYLCYG